VDVVIPIFVLLGFLLPLLKAPRWLAWLMPVFVGAVMARLYVDELNASSGDPQPNLVLLVAIALTIVTALAVLLGSRIERSMRPDTD
jgi:hypothetical protein